MSKQARGLRIFAFCLVIAAAILVVTFGCARASTFDERFPAETTKPNELIPGAQKWGIKVLLLIDSKIAHAIDYDDKIYATGDECRGAILADKSLQASAQSAAAEAVEKFGRTASIALACAMQLD